MFTSLLCLKIRNDPPLYYLNSDSPLFWRSLIFIYPILTYSWRNLDLFSAPITTPDKKLLSSKTVRQILISTPLLAYVESKPALNLPLLAATSITNEPSEPSRKFKFIFLPSYFSESNCRQLQDREMFCIAPLPRPSDLRPTRNSAPSSQKFPNSLFTQKCCNFMKARFIAAPVLLGCLDK